MKSNRNAYKQFIVNKACSVEMIKKNPRTFNLPPKCSCRINHTHVHIINK